MENGQARFIIIIVIIIIIIIIIIILFAKVKHIQVHSCNSGRTTKQRAALTVAL